MNPNPASTSASTSQDAPSIKVVSLNKRWHYIVNKASASYSVCFLSFTLPTQLTQPHYPICHLSICASYPAAALTHLPKHAITTPSVYLFTYSCTLHVRVSTPPHSSLIVINRLTRITVKKCDIVQCHITLDTSIMSAFKIDVEVLLSSNKH